MKIKRTHFWTIVVAIVTVALVVLLVLIAVGDLVLPGKGAPAPVTVDMVKFTILQENNASGLPWFGPSNFTYTGLANGYPFVVAPGATFTLPVGLENYDSISHTIYSMNPDPPFTLVSCYPSLPFVVPPVLHEDDGGNFDLTIQAPSSSGQTLTMYVVINALS